MRPPFLKAGDKIGLIAPSRRVTDENIQLATSVLAQWGFEAVLSLSLLKDEHSYHGATAEQRCRDLQAMLDDPAIRAIICIRGGYGITQFLDAINWEVYKQNPKWMVGFSDITALHLQLFRLGFESIHGIMPIQFSHAEQAEPMQALGQLLIGNMPPLTWETDASSLHGSARGHLVGGNLSMIVDSLATSSELHTFGQLLFLEEVDEPLYKIDRMLTQLKRARKLDKVTGLVVGQFTGISDGTLPYGQRVEEIIKHKIDRPIPIAFGCPSGHAAPNFSWIHGAQAELSVGNKSKITYV